MKILFINAVDSGDPIEVLFPPLGLAYIASYLRRKFRGIEMQISYDHVESTIKTFKPDLLCISSVTQNYGLAKKYAQIGKKYCLPVVIGGSHISGLPATLGREIDIAVLGEGEETMSEIVERISNGEGRIESCQTVPGIVYRKHGQIQFSPERSEITPLDTIPFPARDLLRIPKRGIVHLFSSRGCPYHCRFCASSCFWDKLRFFSADYVVDEIERVVADYAPITVGFYDDLFIASRRRLASIAENLSRKGYHKKLEFVLNGRANLITDEVATILKEMNVVTVNMGLESGSEKTLSFLKGESVSVETNSRAIETLYRYGINTHGTFIIGCPGETEDDIRKTESFIKKSKLSSFEVYILTPYPGTAIWSLAEEKGLVSNDMDWSRLAQEPKRVDLNKVLMADLVDPKTLYRYYIRLQRLKKSRRLYSRIATAFRNPERLFPAIRKNLTTKVLTN